MSTKICSGPRNCRTIFLSDLHLGSSVSRADLLVGFMKAHHADTYYLIGDIFDDYRDSKANWQSIAKLLHLVANKINEGSTFVYIPGNHDNFFRKLFGQYSPQFRIVAGEIFEGVDGHKYYVTHGDCFDWVVNNFGLIARFSGWLDRRIRRALRLVLGSNIPWLMKAFHATVNKIAIVPKFVERRRRMLDLYGVHALICGHLHDPVIELDENSHIVYMNCGDWLDNYSAIIEEHDGKMELVYWE